MIKHKTEKLDKLNSLFVVSMHNVACQGGNEPWTKLIFCWHFANDDFFHHAAPLILCPQGFPWLIRTGIA